MSMGVDEEDEPTYLPQNPNDGSRLRVEIHSIIYRYGQESDISAYQVIGALEVVKQDMISMMELNETD